MYPMPQTNTLTILSTHPELTALLFKPVQQRIIEKLYNGEVLDENEKRYLRGNLGKKLTAIDQLVSIHRESPEQFIPFTEILQDYYITGFEALKNNGFGWFYEPKRIVIVNTRLKGTMYYKGKNVTFFRVKSLRFREWYMDEMSGLKYATNEQILKDARELGDESLIRIWKSMLNRYGKLFVKHPGTYEDLILKPPAPELPEKYGV